MLGIFFEEIGQLVHFGTLLFPQKHTICINLLECHLSKFGVLNFELPEKNGS